MTRRKINRYQFPWRGGNQFRLHVDGDSFFPAMLEAIAQARHVIALEMYLVTSGKLLDQFIETLLAAAQRGIKVLILLDDFGARGMKHHDRQRLRHNNIKLRFYNPTDFSRLRRSLFRNHRKLLLIDNRIAFTGGAGLTNNFDPGLGDKHFWHDVMLEIHGSCVGDWAQLFKATWPDNRTDLAPLEQIPSPDNNTDQASLGRVAATRSWGRQEVASSLIKHVKSAEHWIYLTTAYFIPTWKLRRALRNAARRGVDVRLILPGPHVDHPAVRRAGQRYYASLLKHGVRIFEYQPRFNHSKIYLCDLWSSIGSSNLDRWNLVWNLEGNQEIDDQTLATQLKQLFEHDMSQACMELHFHDWQRRNLWRRLSEWFWGNIDIWLSRLAIRWRHNKDD